MTAIELIEILRDLPEDAEIVGNRFGDLLVFDPEWDSLGYVEMANGEYSPTDSAGTVSSK